MLGEARGISQLQQLLERARKAQHALSQSAPHDRQLLNNRRLSQTFKLWGRAQSWKRQQGRSPVGSRIADVDHWGRDSLGNEEARVQLGNLSLREQTRQGKGQVGTLRSQCRRAQAW